MLAVFLPDSGFRENELLVDWCDMSRSSCRVGARTTLEIGECAVAAFGTKVLKPALKEGLNVMHVIHA